MSTPSESAMMPTRRKSLVSALYQGMTSRATTGYDIYSSEDKSEIFDALNRCELLTLEVIASSIKTHPSVKPAWITGLLTDGASDKEARDFAVVLGYLASEEGHSFDTNEVRDIARGLYRFLSGDTELCVLDAGASKSASALARVVAAVWLYAPISPVDGIIDDEGTQIRLSDDRLMNYVVDNAEIVDEIIAYIKDYGSANYEVLTRHFNITPILREGDL